MLSDYARDVAPAIAPDLNPEQTAVPKDGWMDPATEALPSVAIVPNIDLTLRESHVVRLPDPSPATDSEPPALVPIESD